MFHKPRQTCRLRREAQRLQCECLPRERSTLNSDIAELSLDICNDAIVGGRCRAQYWDVVRHPLQNVDEAPVVGAKVMAPVGYAMGLVYDEQTNRLRDRQQHILHEIVVC